MSHFRCILYSISDFVVGCSNCRSFDAVSKSKINFEIIFRDQCFRYPWHASCVIQWRFPEDCQAVQTKLVNQIKAWEVCFHHVLMCQMFLMFLFSEWWLSWTEWNMLQLALWTEVSLQSDLIRRHDHCGHSSNTKAQVCSISDDIWFNVSWYFGLYLFQ